MRSCLNVIGVIFLGLFLLCGFAALVAPESAPRPAVTQPSTEPATVAKVEEPAPTPEHEPVVPAGPRLTRVTFDQCRPGMTYDEVIEIVGDPDSLMSENEIAGYHTAMYMWKGGIFANANMTFQNGKLVSKAQFGL